MQTPGVDSRPQRYYIFLICKLFGGKITQIQKPNLQRNDTFKAMHIDALNLQNHICTFSQAMDTMRLIDQIQKENQ